MYPKYFHHFALAVLIGLAIFVAMPSDAASPEATNSSTAALFSESLQDLMNTPVSIVSGSPEKLSTAPAAVSVITQADIARSGATTIPDALRLVPGLDVARLDDHTWAISSRGFNDVFADKLLVMIDGRTVYTPLFSGVFWDVQDTLMEDIDRIEVVRGPGATIWGANAVNGVINIITRSAANSQGFLISAGGGYPEGDFANFRYGFTLDDGVYLKLYAKYFNRDASNLPQGSEADDAWSMLRGGFRLDVDRTNQNVFTAQGDMYTGLEHEIYMVPTPLKTLDNVAGGNLLGRWTHTFSEDSQVDVQAYYDHTARNVTIFGEDRDTFDLTAQHNFALGERQEVTWGADYRHTQGHITDSPYIAFVDPDRSLDLYSAFVQDDIALINTNLYLTVGSKFEHNDFTGFEIQPSGRMVWTPGGRQALWGAVSRAVRTPSQAESDIILKTTGTPILGNPDMVAEDLLAYELGYRIQPLDRLTLDLSSFYNHYDRLRNEELLLTPTGPAAQANNNLAGRSYGGEGSATVQVLDSWRLTGGLSYCQINIDGDDIAHTAELLADSSPRYQLFLRSSLDLPYHITFDSTFRYVDTISFPASEIPGTVTHIPSYATFDLRLAWNPCPNFEAAIVGQNLAQSQHLEFAPTYIPTEQTAVLRNIYGEITLRF
jgi:iron complex outermembrane receptor protein